MGKVMNLIADKLEEFRIEGKSPGWIGLSGDKMIQLKEELEKVNDMRISEIIKFLGLPVLHSVLGILDQDGICIIEKSYGRWGLHDKI